MAIRTKKFRRIYTDQEVRAIQITTENLTDIVAYICRNGGAATGHLGRSYNVTRSGKAAHRPPRIRIKQETHGIGHYGEWSKIDWRVAKLGDWIVRNADGSFERVKANEFEHRFVA